MKIPDSLRISFKDEAGVPVKNLFCLVTFYFGRHNCLPITQTTSIEGQITISLEQVRNELKESQNTFLMDYKFQLDEFDGNIEAVVEDKNLLQKRIKKIGEYYPENALRITNILQEINNDHYIPISKKIIIDSSPFKTEIVLSRKKTIQNKV
ncbi:hypothetical protein [Gimesia aquarii]|uniref:Uncharacterized protein n=1 Tax=Gimesia aquarii TaxID=2527964 RepID=A0A517WSE6_9PLAN|nr:hypothetical protein [Gimesia aquarii]QDU08170.1 hypothetical protein V202x_15340 [Gimesia aquarii]